jgi:outer membrane protein OmpA-like peptidoglycan-associated protein
MNTSTPLHLGLLYLAFSLVFDPLAAQEAKPLDASTLEALEEKPAVPTMRSRSARVEKSREYRVSNEATARSGGARARGVRVITYADDTVEEKPLVEIPLLFEVNSDQLKGVQSQANLRLLAEKLNALRGDGLQVSIEGHASAEGSEKRNQELSELRAKAIVSKLLELGVDQAVIKSSRGYGSKFAEHSAEALDADRELDRRVLVVRER